MTRYAVYELNEFAEFEWPGEVCHSLRAAFDALNARLYDLARVRCRRHVVIIKIAGNPKTGTGKHDENQDE